MCTTIRGLHCQCTLHGIVSLSLDLSVSMAESLGSCSCDQQVTGSNPSHHAAQCNTEQVVCTHVPLSQNSIIWYQAMACLGGSVGWGTVRTDWNGLPEGRGSIPGSAGRFRVRISGAHALRLISRAGKESSTVSSIICDRWLILS